MELQSHHRHVLVAKERPRACRLMEGTCRTLDILDQERDLDNTIEPSRSGDYVMNHLLPT
jgi:hypothetical protein